MENKEQRQQANKEHPKLKGTLAIDLGNSTTIVAFQGEYDPETTLLELDSITRAKGEIPSLVWVNKEEEPNLLIGQEVIDHGLANSQSACLSSDFKRWIGAPQYGSKNLQSSNLSAEEAGTILITEIWKRLPPELEIRKLVLTAPVETYRGYRNWLLKTCKEFNVKEIALVDEPTAAAMGAGLPAGSKLLVVDIGGSTIDMSIVALEGGEGKAEPVAQLLRFAGEDLEAKSKQVLRCAKVLGKSGQRLGGRDIDRWIANYVAPKEKINESLLNAAERIKCKLSSQIIKETKYLRETFKIESNQQTKDFELCRLDFELLLKEQKLIQSLDSLFNQTVLKSEANGCGIKELINVVLVGGGSRIPLIQKWLEEKSNPIPLLKPPPIEAIAKGALKLTPGVIVKDVLQKGISLRFWDERTKGHIWHPLFYPGQPWPTKNPLEIILGASNPNQMEIELIIGELQTENSYEVMYREGIPILSESEVSEPQVKEIQHAKHSLSINPPGQPGEDCLKLNFSINDECELLVEGIDIRSDQKISKLNLLAIR